MAAVDEILVELKTNLPDMRKAMLDLSMAVGKLNKSFVDSSKSMKKFSDTEEEVEERSKKLTSGTYSLTAALSKTETVAKNLKNTFDLLKSKYVSLWNATSPLNLGIMGLSFSMTDLIKTAYNEVISLSSLGDSMTYMSTATGSVTQAINLLHKAAGQSAISITSMESVLKTLYDQGVRSEKGLLDLSKVIGDVKVATGIASENFGAFAGELNYKYKVPADGIRRIASAIIATGLTSKNFETIVGTVNKVLDQTAFIARNKIPGSFEQTTKAISSAILLFDKMGVSADKAGAFIENFTNPRNFEKNVEFFGRMGISAQEYLGYLKDANGQAKLITRVMTKLPELAQQISAVSDPLAMIEFAERMGMSEQMVRELAGKTQSEMVDLIKEYEKKAEAEKALQLKQKERKEETDKINDEINILKRKALGPLMNFVTNDLQRILNIFSKVSSAFEEVLTQLLPTIETVSKYVKDFTIQIIDFVRDFGPPFIKGLTTAAKKVEQILLYFFEKFQKAFEFIKKMFPSTFSVESGKGKAEKAGEYLGYGLAAYGALKAFNWLRVGTKNVMKATVSELANAIGIAVNEHSKKGGSWLGRIVSSAMGLAARTGLRVAKVAAPFAAGYYAYNKVSKEARENELSNRAENQLGTTSAYYAAKSATPSRYVIAFNRALEKSGGIVEGMRVFGKTLKTLDRLKEARKFSPSSFSLKLLGKDFKELAIAAVSPWKGLKNLKGGMISTLLGDILGGDIARRIANKAIKDSDPNKKEKVKAARNLGSFAGSTAMSFLGGPWGAAINAAFTGAARALESKEKILKSMESRAGGNLGFFRKTGAEANIFDKIADTVQVGLGGAFTLGVGHAIDDLIKLTTGKTTEVGDTVAEFMAQYNPFVVAPVEALRLVARGIDVVQSGIQIAIQKGKEGYAIARKAYAAELITFNKKINLEVTRMMNSFRDGKYAEGFSSAIEIIKLAFKRFFILPLKTFGMGIRNAIVGMFANIQKYVKEKTGFSVLGEWAINLEEKIKTEANAIQEITNLLNSNQMAAAQQKISAARAAGYDMSSVDDLISVIKEQEAQRIADKKREQIVNEVKEKEKRVERNKDLAKAVHLGTMETENKKQEAKRDAVKEAPKDMYDDIIKNLIKGGLIRVQG